MSFSFGASPFVRKPFLFGGWGDWSIPGVSLVHPEARYDINFAAGQWFGALPSDLVVSRASDALTLTPGGSYANFTSNTARITGNGLMVEEARTNAIRNPRGSGAVAGSPGTLPTNWIGSATPVAGISREIIGAVTVNGISGVRIRWFGTPTATGTNAAIVVFDATNAIAAAAGQTWVSSFGCALAAGSLSGVTGFSNDIAERDSSGNALSNGLAAISVTNAFQEFSHTRTMQSATTAFVVNRLTVSVTNGVAVDFTLDIAAPLLRQASFAGSPILNAAGVTNAATVQPADVVYLPISGIGTEYTLYHETPILASHVSAGSLVEMWASNNDRTRVTVNQTVQQPTIIAAGASRLAPSLSAGSGAPRRIAYRVQAGAIRMCANGTLSTVDTGAIPAAAPIRAYIGSGGGGSTGFLNDNLRRIAIIPRALSDSELVSLTS